MLRSRRLNLLLGDLEKERWKERVGEKNRVKKSSSTRREGKKYNQNTYTVKHIVHECKHKKSVLYL